MRNTTCTIRLSKTTKETLQSLSRETKLPIGHIVRTAIHGFIPPVEMQSEILTVKNKIKEADKYIKSLEAQIEV